MLIVLLLEVIDFILTTLIFYNHRTNAQLWSAALGMQFLQSFLPFGFVWRPIMDELVKGISIVESESLQRVSYYVETTDFIQWLQASGNYSDVKTTGHSLGTSMCSNQGLACGAFSNHILSFFFS